MPVRSLRWYLPLLFLPLAASAAEPVPAPAERELDLTVYRPGVALVRDRRPIDLEAGNHRLVWPNVADTLQWDSVRLAGEAPELRAYRRSGERLTLQRLVEGYVGREVRFTAANGDNGGVGEIVSADPLLVRTDAGVRPLTPERLVFPGGVPDALMSSPGLALDIATDRRWRQPLRLDYLAEGFAWSLDYVARLSADGSRLRLEARASIANASGMAVRDARVELIAGEPAIPRGDRGNGAEMMQARSMSDAAAPPEAAGDYYHLALPRPVTLEAGERTSVAVFDRPSIPVERQYVLRSDARITGTKGPAPGWRSVPLTTTLAWTVGDRPQPAGTLRVYEPRPGDEGVRLVGGDRLGDRAAGEQVEVALGRPFDIVAERRRTDWQRGPDERTETVTREIRVRNAGQREASIRIEESIPGEWEMLEASDEWERASADLAVWRFEIEGGGERLLRYRVRIKR
ncbi:DUF4139 domain-containing protein [Halofilum ochraceum]|uniref:DUF4139 domain-containing protein n=1 Tax=Halofilum ochraceum TaxID=1611323 RepID=UPI0011130301|nr:hypothetical protein [Halofilum ochraceum]